MTRLMAPLLLLLLALPAQAQPRLHALFVFDTDGAGIGVPVRRDKFNMLRSVHGGFRDAGQEARLVWSVLDGAKVTPQNVLQGIAALRPAAGDAVLVYYAGHGATDPTRGHFLALTRGGLLRSSVQAAIAKHQCRLTVLITESCSNVMGGSAGVQSRVPTGDWDVLQALFFGAKGRLDVNSSARGQVAHASPETGAFFTHCLAGVLCSPSQGLTWKEAIDRAEQGLWKIIPRQRQECCVWSMAEAQAAPAGPAPVLLPE